MRDKIIEQVINKIKSRSDVGFKKYGVTLSDDEQSLDTWLKHIQEELMDAILYIQAAREELQDNVVKQAIKHADHAAFSSSSAQLDWDDAISPI